MEVTISQKTDSAQTNTILWLQSKGKSNPNTNSCITFDSKMLTVKKLRTVKTRKNIIVTE
jgi:hypothetical protein